MSEADVDHLCQMLKMVIRAADRTGKEIEKELEMSPGYLSRLLGGGIELKVSHIFNILELAGMPPHELFSAAFPPTTREPSPVLRKLLQLKPEVWSEALAPAPLDRQDLEQKLGEAVRQVLAGLERP
jgi:transcriptional regulator with XRE-family HTH domain